jgi:predicted dehydrogenase
LVSAAPCTLLGETAQTIWRALRQGRLGKVRLVYAELDDGLMHRMPYNAWLSDSGTPWPFKDEFEIGCTVEHAAYYLTWLVAFFGPARSLTAWASVQVPDKQTTVALDAVAPDFSVACLQFESGVTARLTCSIVAPHDHGLRIVGDDGLLTTKDCWMFRSPVGIRRNVEFRGRRFQMPWTAPCRLLGRNNPRIPRRGAAQVDWCRGVADLAAAIRDRRRPRLAPDFCLHVTELTLGIHNAMHKPGTVSLATTFDPIEPMDWAK